MKYIKISIDTSDEAMVGADGWGNADASASTDSFLEMVAAKIKEEYPGVRVSVSSTDSGYGSIEIDGTDDHEDKAFIDNIISDVFVAQAWYVEDDIRIELIAKYEKLGREIAETETYMDSEDAWESEDTHRTLTTDEKEIAADAFGEGFVSYIPQELSEVMTPGEAVEVYGLAEATPRQAINRGQIFARKSGGTWLIRRNDADRLWGKQ